MGSAVASIPWTSALLALAAHGLSAVPLSNEPAWAAQRKHPVTLLWGAEQIAKGLLSATGGFSILLARWRQLGM